MTGDTGNLTADTTLVHREGSISSELDGERVILALDSGTYYGVNEVGALIWELLSEPCTIGELQTQVATEFGTTVTECEQDVRTFCAHLLENDLVEIRPEA